MGPKETSTPRNRGAFLGVISVEDLLTREEEWLRRAEASAHVAVVAREGLSYGVGTGATANFLERAREARFPTVRRSTGGSGLLHRPGDLLWSVVLTRSDPLVGRDYARAYGRLGAGVVRFLASLGLAARWAPPPGLRAEYCTLSSRGEALWAGERILGGAAQHATRDTLLHHGTVSLEVDRSAIDRLFGLEVPSPTDRLAGLRDLGVAEAPEALGAALATELGRTPSGP